MKYCCEELSDYMEREMFSLFNLNGKHIVSFCSELYLGQGEEDKYEPWVAGEKITYCPFCGVKLNRGKQ